MKQGRFLRLVNNTSYDWIKTTGNFLESMVWNLPEKIGANTSAEFYVEWETGSLLKQGYNLAETAYSLTGTKDTFRVQAKGDGNFVILLVYCDNLVIKAAMAGEVIPLDLSSDGSAVFSLSGSHSNYSLDDVVETSSKEETITYSRKSGNQNGLGLLEAGHKVNAYWEAETRSISYLNGLHFPGDRKWESCLVEVRGTKKSQSFIIEIRTDGRLAAREEFTLKQDEIRVIERRIESSSSIDITGQLKSTNAVKAGGNIYVSCSFSSGIIFKTQSVLFKTAEDGISNIGNLYLYAAQLWEKCEIYIEGYEKSSTGCMLTLISNGEIDKNGRLDWLELRDKQSKTFSIELHKKIPIVVAGYVASQSETGGGAVITLTGFYK